MSVIVTKLRRDPDGIWRARVTVDGVTADVERRGGWHVLARVAPRKRSFELRELKPWIAAELQSRLPAEARKPKSSRRAEA